MKRLLVLLTMVATTASLVIAGCGQAPAAPTAAPAAKPAAAPAAQPTSAPAAPATAAPAAQPTTAAAPKVTFPEKGKTITIIVPYAAGGTTDSGARFLAAGLEKELGTPVQVVNKPGASAQVGITEMFQSKPDGYTLSEGVLPTIINHYVDTSRNAPYKGLQDFTLVAHHFLTPQVFAVMANSKWKTLKDLVDDAKANPDKIRVSDSGLLANPHLTTLMLSKAAGVKFASVHFDGGAPSVTALLGGHVEVLAGGTSDALSNWKAGTFRVLGVADSQESQFFPGVPTFKAQGYDVISVSSTGIQAPKGTPKEVVNILTTAIKKILATDEHKQKLLGLGAEVKYMDPEQYAAFWKDTEARTAPFFKEQAAANK